MQISDDVWKDTDLASCHLFIHRPPHITPQPASMYVRACGVSFLRPSIRTTRQIMWQHYKPATQLTSSSIETLLCRITRVCCVCRRRVGPTIARDRTKQHLYFAFLRVRKSCCSHWIYSTCPSSSWYVFCFRWRMVRGCVGSK